MTGKIIRIKLYFFVVSRYDRFLRKSIKYVDGERLGNFNPPFFSSFTINPSSNIFFVNTAIMFKIDPAGMISVWPFWFKCEKKKKKKKKRKRVVGGRREKKVGNTAIVAVLFDWGTWAWWLLELYIAWPKGYQQLWKMSEKKVRENFEKKIK